MDTSLSIIPPESAWDTIQRARHFARDATYHTWPPAIRLFHPFVSKQDLHSIAFNISKCVEDEDINPFEITIDSLLIVPHVEILEENLRSMNDLPTTDDEYYDIDDDTDDDGGIEELIRQEEEVGKERLLRRLQRKQNKAKTSIQEEEEDVIQNINDKGPLKNKKKGKGKKTKKQKKQSKNSNNKDFNGPCIICLEPNDESKRRIDALRSNLLHSIFSSSSLEEKEMFNAFSVSSSMSPNSKTLPDAVLRKHQPGSGGETFRPILPIGSFPTVSSALKVAHKLQALWEPLTFNITDLHLISRGTGGAKKESFSSSSGQNTNSNGKFNYNDGDSIHKDDLDIPELQVRQGRYKKNQQRGNGISSPSLSTSHSNDDSTSSSTKIEEKVYGCDAMIMLMGEEQLHLLDSEEGNESENDDVEEDLLRLLLDAGEEGGKQVPSGTNENAIISTPLRTKSFQEQYYDQEDDDDSVLNGVMRDWKMYLDDDEEWDEGASVVIGRIHFFVGEMRQYIGMPASSTMDGKDRVMGDGISAAVRRSPSMSRQTNRWEEGEYGHRDGHFYSS